MLDPHFRHLLAANGSSRQPLQIPRYLAAHGNLWHLLPFPNLCQSLASLHISLQTLPSPNFRHFWGRKRQLAAAP